MAFTARPQLRCSWGWVPTLRSISSTSPVSSMMPATMPRWSISCTSIRGASAVLSMLHKIPHPPSVPAECGLMETVRCLCGPIQILRRHDLERVYVVLCHHRSDSHLLLWSHTRQQSASKVHACTPGPPELWIGLHLPSRNTANEGSRREA